MQHVLWAMLERGKNPLYNHSRGTKALFCCVNLQVNNSVGGKTMQKSLFGSIAAVPPPGMCVQWLAFP